MEQLLVNTLLVITRSTFLLCFYGLRTARLLKLQPSWGGQQKYVHNRGGLLLITGRVGPGSPVVAAALRTCTLIVIPK